MLKSYGLFVKAVTNGTLLTQYAQDIIASGIDAITVSVDGDRATHNQVRQRAWAYDRTMEGLRALVEARAQAGRATPFIRDLFHHVPPQQGHGPPEALRRPRR